MMTANGSSIDQRSDRRLAKAALDQAIKTSRRAVLVVNTRSRRGAHFYSEAKRRLTEAGFVLDAAYPVRHAQRMPEVVQEAIAQGHKFIIVGGGDGTISSVVDYFAYANVVFGLLPLGTANSFARELGIPGSLEGAIGVIANGKVADVDLVLINGDYFVNTATLGLAPGVARSTPHALKKFLGRTAYLLVGMVKFLSFRPFQVRVIEDDHERNFDALQVLLANGRYFGGVLVAHDASSESRKIAVQIINGPSRWNLIRAWWAVATGRRPDPGIAAEFVISDAVIEAEPRQYVSVDGEVATQTPIHLAIAHEALNVMVPAEFDDSDGDRPG
ncbi:MAG: YegS/Rv2252/BmrU family lipid kinase [Xanthomonadaceae bacterium]|nr:YegS/Rv2252/BmrU family lipid kinase [Xanthomonadaceae bacterium]